MAATLTAIGTAIAGGAGAIGSGLAAGAGALGAGIGAGAGALGNVAASGLGALGFGGLGSALGGGISGLGGLVGGGISGLGSGLGSVVGGLGTGLGGILSHPATAGLLKGGMSLANILGGGGGAAQGGGLSAALGGARGGAMALGPNSVIGGQPPFGNAPGVPDLLGGIAGAGAPGTAPQVPTPAALPTPSGGSAGTSVKDSLARLFEFINSDTVQTLFQGAGAVDRFRSEADLKRNLARTAATATGPGGIRFQPQANPALGGLQSIFGGR